eukprot:7142604-Prymnesium_polylepis.1
MKPLADEVEQHWIWELAKCTTRSKKHSVAAVSMNEFDHLSVEGPSMFSKRAWQPLVVRPALCRTRVVSGSPWL